jgi:hypothetical protein
MNYSRYIKVRDAMARRVDRRAAARVITGESYYWPTDEAEIAYYEALEALLAFQSRMSAGAAR